MRSRSRRGRSTRAAWPSVASRPSRWSSRPPSMSHRTRTARTPESHRYRLQPVACVRGFPTRTTRCERSGPRQCAVGGAAYHWPDDGHHRGNRRCTFGPRAAVRGAPDGAHRICVQDARFCLRGRGRRAGDVPARVEGLRRVRGSFEPAFQHLPPKQRAVLVLAEVLRWKASEVAELLETSVQSVNSALQRARATLANIHAKAAPAEQIDEKQARLIERYVDAFQRYDMDSLTSLLREDATWNMPPYELWLQTHDDIRGWCLGPGIGCRGSRLIPVAANGSPAFGQYKPSEDGGLEPWSLQVLEISGGRISGITFFLDTQSMFPLFGLPERLDA